MKFVWIYFAEDHESELQSRNYILMLIINTHYSNDVKLRIYSIQTGLHLKILNTV